jgi:uncharacterized membrane protein
MHAGAQTRHVADGPTPHADDPKHEGRGERGMHGMADMHGTEGGHGGHGGQGEHEDHREMLRTHHEGMLWCTLTNIVLGLWLISSAASADYGGETLRWSDAISGTLMVAFGVVALVPRWDLARWGICFTGIWLLFAPLVFWAPTAFVYANDTLVGALAIGLSVLVPMMPGMGHHMAMMAPGPEVPAGWTYNPSSWLQRAPSIALAFVSFLLARYLTAFQLGHIQSVWDPFFGDGTRQVLESEVSKMWPISDAGLGALSYLLEALSGYMGGQQRWRTMPWMVLMFGFLVIPLGVTSIVLVILQPLAVGTWCTLCLLTALFMLVMIPLTVDEVVAMVQFMVAARRKGQSAGELWRTFWVGGTLKEENEDDRTPQLTAAPEKLGPAMVWGVSLPWTLVTSAVVGLWLMLAPAILGSQGGAADSDHLFGALVVTVAVIALGEPVRAVRYLNIALGAWIVASPFVMGGATTASMVNAVVVGAVLVGLSLPRGSVRERYGGWMRYVV